MDDEMTRHLIRRQFTRQNTNEWAKPSQPPSRRDSTFPGIRKRLRGSFAETDDFEDVSGRLDEMEKTMARMEVMLTKMMPSTEADGSDDSGREVDGFTVESSYRGTTQAGDE